MASTATGPTIWFWTEGAAAATRVSRLPLIGVGVLIAWFVPIAAILSVGLLG